MRKDYLIIALVMGIFFIQPAVAAETYKIVVDDWTPYSYVEDNKQKGTDIDLLNAVGKKTGITFEFLFVPWARAIDMVKSGNADGIISLYDTPERRDFLLYTKTPLSTETIIVIAPTHRKLPPVRSMKELAGLSIGITPDTSYGKEFDNFSGYIKEPCMSTDIKIAKLIGNRMDVAVINQASFKARLKRDPSLKTKVTAMPLIINRQNLYLAFSKKANESRKFKIDKISGALEQLRRDGTLTKINEAYFGALK